MQQKFFNFQCISLSQFSCAQWNEIHKKITLLPLFVCFWRDSPQWAMASSFTRFLDHTKRRITVGRTPLDEWSARRRDLYLTTQQHSQQINVHSPCGIRTHNLSSRATADLCLRPRGHLDRHGITLNVLSGLYSAVQGHCCPPSLSIQKLSVF